MLFAARTGRVALGFGLLTAVALAGHGAPRALADAANPPITSPCPVDPAAPCITAYERPDPAHPADSALDQFQIGGDIQATGGYLRVQAQDPETGRTVFSTVAPMFAMTGDYAGWSQFYATIRWVDIRCRAHYLQVSAVAVAPHYSKSTGKTYFTAYGPTSNVASIWSSACLL